MSQNYNINMKKFNGTDYDGLLPLAYNALNSQQLDGKTFNEIQTLLTSTDLYLYTGTYKGTGTYGTNNPTVLTFPFEPVIIFMPTYMKYDSYGVDIIQAHMVTTSYNVNFNPFLNRQNSVYYIKCSTDRKTFSLYSNDAICQYNADLSMYYFTAIGGYDMGGGNEWIITSSETWTVPRTGRYYIELYGMGGIGQYYYSNCASGGSSCQSYDNVQMTKGSSIAVVIGSNSSSKTSFGSKSVDNGGNAANATTPGKGTGNLGADGVASSSGDYVINYGKGVLSKQYGAGGGNIGSPGAVYIKYLGA